LSEIWVKKNEKVKAGQIIGLTGNTGNANTLHWTEDHLHFDIGAPKFVRAKLKSKKRNIGNKINPLHLLQGVTPYNKIKDNRRNRRFKRIIAGSIIGTLLTDGYISLRSYFKNLFSKINNKRDKKGKHKRK